MPRYTYQCRSCEGVLNVYHSIKETLHDCTLCHITGSLGRMLSTPLLTKKIGSTKVGEVTENFIEDAKKELSLQKKALKKKR